MIQAIILFMLSTLVFVTTGCSSNADTTEADDIPVVLNDSTECSPVLNADFAEQLFTESDRQWLCSVTNEVPGTTVDEIYFTRSGQAESTRFGRIFWNRSLIDQSINIASPSLSPLVIDNIFSANTVLFFDLVSEAGVVEAYDCVLVGREPEVTNKVEIASAE